MKHSKIPLNPILAKLPQHLQQYLLPQHYEHYSPVDQSIWRYVMRRNINFLKDVAHESYLEGLTKAGISQDDIPDMYGMNRILKDIGWAAASIDGLIPSSAFMEFQAYNVLVIASEIRTLEHIEYTPAPDIIHESAGHAPIISVPEYGEYLRRFGELGCKAIAVKQEKKLFDAVRELTILKENPTTPTKKTEEIEAEIIEIQSSMDGTSEMQKIRNLHWWTVEYGLIGTLEKPKIYGAGLLSSIGESEWCLSDKVKKIPYTIEASKQTFDVTKPQPQLFVTPDFAHLSYVLEEFANTLSVRNGGLSGVQKLIDSDMLGTVELSTGLQISGIFNRVISDEKGKVCYVQTRGDSALAYREGELINHGTKDYPKGIGSPIGQLKGVNLPIEEMSPTDLEAYHISEGKYITLHFEGDIILKGEVITGTRNIQGKILVITFKNCEVSYHHEILFHPSQGIFNLTVGSTVVSAYAGCADLSSFDLINHKLSKQQSQATDHPLKKEVLYQQVRDIRGQQKTTTDIASIFAIVEKEFSNEWLLILEIYELAKTQLDLRHKCDKLLKNIQKTQPEKSHLIEEGMKLL